LMAGTEVSTSALTTTKGTTKQSQRQILENMTRTNAPRNGQFPAYATVVRDNGKQMRVSSKSLVPGDIVELRVGQIVPCDCVYRGSGLLFVTRNSNYLINTAMQSISSSSLLANGTPCGGAGGDELSMLFGDDDNEMDSLDLIGISEGEPILGGSVIYAGCGAAIVGRTGPRTAIARKMQQIKQIEEYRTNAAGIFGFFSTSSSSHQNRSRKPSMARSKSFGALFGTSASTPRRGHHHRHQISTAALTTIAAPPRGSAFDRSLDLVMTGVAGVVRFCNFALALFGRSGQRILVCVFFCHRIVCMRVANSCESCRARDRRVGYSKNGESEGVSRVQSWTRRLLSRVLFERTST